MKYKIKKRTEKNKQTNKQTTNKQTNKKQPPHPKTKQNQQTRSAEVLTNTIEAIAFVLEVFHLYRNFAHIHKVTKLQKKY